MIVSDSSVIIELLIDGPQSQRAERVYRIDSDWWAPMRWRSECVSTLWKKLSCGEVDRGTAFAAIDNLERTVKQTVAVDLKQTLELALSSKHTPYDCEYVVLATELDARLLTLDQRVIERFPKTATTPFAWLRERDRA